MSLDRFPVMQQRAKTKAITQHETATSVTNQHVSRLWLIAAGRNQVADVQPYQASARERRMHSIPAFSTPVGLRWPLRWADDEARARQIPGTCTSSDSSMRGVIAADIQLTTGIA